MADGILASIFFGFGSAFLFAYILYWLDRYEKEPLPLLGGVFTWGALLAAGGAFVINTLLGMGVYIATGSEGATEITTGTIIAPIIEESLKGLAVLAVFLVFRKEFDSVLDGIIYAGVAALGFAATENSFYIYTYGFAEQGWEGLLNLVFVRVVLVGWQHPFYTAWIGIGLAAARLNPNPGIKLAAPLLGWIAAVTTHAIHNAIAILAGGVGGLIAGTALDWLGWAFMLFFILFAIHRERDLIRRYLQDEIALGSLTDQQYTVATSAWKQFQARAAAVLTGRYRGSKRFYQLCADLAHKKRQSATLGEAAVNQATIEQMRAEMQRLSAEI